MLRGIFGRFTSSGGQGERSALVALRTFLPFIRPHWRGFVPAVIGVIAASLVALLKPWPLGFLINNVLQVGQADPNKPASPTMMILAVAGAIVGIAALQGLFNYLKEFFLSASSERVAFSVRRALFAHMQRLSLTFHDRQRTGDMITRVTSDVTKVQELVTDKLLVDGISSVLQFAGMLTVMYVIDWRIGLIATAWAPLVVIASSYFRRRIRDEEQHVRQREGDFTSLTQETISSIRVVKAFARGTLRGREIRRADGRDGGGQRERSAPGGPFRLGYDHPDGGRAGRGRRLRRAPGSRWGTLRGYARRLRPVHERPSEPAEHAFEALGQARESRGAGGAHHGGVRRAPGGGRATRREDRAPLPGGGALRGRLLRLRPGSAGAARHRPGDPAGRSGGGRGGHRRREEHSVESDPAPLRPCKGLGAHRRARHSRLQARFAGRTDRSGPPGVAPLPDDHSGEHRVRQSQSDLRGDPGGRPPRLLRGLHPEPAERVRHGGRGARGHAVGGTAAAHRHRPRRDPGRPDTHPGRADHRARRRGRGDRNAGAGAADGGTYDADDRPQALHREPGEQDLRPQRRGDRGGRHT